MLSRSNAGTVPTNIRAFKLLPGLFIFLSVFALSFIGKIISGTSAPGVVTELRCDEGTGTTIADASGNGHTGILNNGTGWRAGKYGQGVSFDGIDDYVNVEDHADYTLDPTASYTWSAWVMNTNFNPWSTVWSQTSSSTDFFYFYAHTTTDAEAGPVTNGVSVYWYNGNNKLVIHSNNNVLTAGQWSNVAVTYNGSVAQNLRFTIYVNGVDVTNRTDVVSTGTIAAIDPDNIRAGSNQPYGEYLNGSVDEIRYYRRLLSVTEILGDMNANTADTESPTINITAPVAGNVAGTININANAADNVAVAGVQFLLNDTNLGSEDLTAPYSFSWNTTTLADGNYKLTAIARDAAGNITTSSPVNVTILNHLPDTEAPTVSIPPVPADVSGTISITAYAGDNVGVAGVQFLLNGSALGNEDLVAPYSVSWNTTTVANGTYILTARARDAAGNSTTSEIVNVTVKNDIEMPVVSIIAPAAGSVSDIITITASASDNVGVAGVQFLLDGANIGAEDLTAPYSISWNTAAVANGNYTLTAKAWDDAGNTTISPGVIISVNNVPDTESPTVTITSPSTRNVSGTINVKAITNDNVGVAGVQFQLDGANLGAEDLTAPFSVSWNTTTASNGNHTLIARARDTSGNTANSAIVYVTVKNDMENPEISIISPAAGNVSGAIDITADATDNAGITGVQFFLDGVAFGAEDIVAPYSVSWNVINTSNGNHTLTAKARDDAGNTATSPAVIVTVNNPPDTESPTVIITSPSTRNVLGVVNVNANASDNAGVTGVQFLLDGSNLGIEDLAAPYSVSWNTISVANGKHTLTARARDAAGNTTISSAVIVTVNNPPDVESPVITITSPSAGNVSGTINVNANATDNIGVAGVQFLLDGANLGAEDITAPFSVPWNTSLVTTGTHSLSARARDVAGNTTTAANVIVVTSDPPVITAIAVSSITPGSAVITWTTNIPANSQVNYGPTTAYGLSTLVDATLATSHSQILTGLLPGTLYHYQVLSSNGILTTSADKTFTTANLAASLGNLNGHTVLAYPSGKIIPWTPNPAEGYHTVMTLAWNYLLSGVPNDPSTGKPAYYSRSLLDPSTTAMVNWPHNPAGTYAMMIESALKFYGYSGNANVMQIALNVAIWHLDHGMTLASDNWPSVPYASGDAGSVNYGGAVMGNASGQGDGVGILQPDKIGELGNAWLQLYKYNGNIRFRDAAIQAGNVLSSKVRVGTATQSPWPFRVNAHTGVVREEYCSDIIAQISLLDNLIASGLGNVAAYQAARTTAWNWMMAYPMQNNIWAQYFEDVGVQPEYNNNLNQYNAMMVARYLLEHPEFDPSWEAHVRGLISWVETKFGQASFGATAIKEQQTFPYAMGSHSARYASVNALLYEKTGDLVAKEKAYRAFNWATYMARTNGVVIDGPDVNTQWFTDGYGDYVRHFMTGIGSVPEWSPSDQTHLLRSSSVIKSISYGTNTVNYTTYDGTGVDLFHINFNPVTVTANGVALPQRSDLTQPGWTLDVATKTLRIYHTGATQISISTIPSSRLVLNVSNEGNKAVVQR